MKRRIAIAVFSYTILISGCAAIRQPACATNQLDTDWGPEKGGLQTRLSVAGPFHLGRPMFLRLELRNISDEPARCEVGLTIETNGPLEITGPSGAKVPYLMGYNTQTGVRSMMLPPGREIVLVDAFDLSENYLLTEHGEYIVTWQGREILPNSNTIRINVQPGRLRRFELACIRLVSAAPGHKWSFQTVRGYTGHPDTDAIRLFLSYPTDQQSVKGSYHASIQVIICQPEIVGARPGEHMPERLGVCEWGTVYTDANPDIVNYWPDFKKDIAAALDVK